MVRSMCEDPNAPPVPALGETSDRCTVAHFPIPPDVEKTNGVKEPCSLFPAYVDNAIFALC